MTQKAKAATTTTRRSTRTTAKKTAPKKRATRTTGDAAVEAAAVVTKADARSSAPIEGVSRELAEQARGVDREGLGDKLRVHQLAKVLGITSKDMVGYLAEVGIEKKAQSSLSNAEACLVLDKIAEPVLETGDKTVEALRYEVGKNVENEIHQITEKVERELADKVDDDDLAGDASGDRADDTGDDTDEDAVDIELDVDFDDEDDMLDDEYEFDDEDDEDEDLDDDDDDDVDDEFDDDDFDDEDSDEEDDRPELKTIDIREEARREENAELLEDVVSAVTPVPEDVDSTFVTPVFKAPVPVKVAPKKTRSRDDGDEDSHPRRSRRSRDDRESKPKKVRVIDEPAAIKGSTRLEAQRRRRIDRKREARNTPRHVISEAEFRARRDAVDRIMLVRERSRSDHPGAVTQVVVLEDGKAVEHFVTSETQSSMVGNIYLGRVQNVLPSMEAAFIDIGKGRNGVLYAGEIDWRSTGLGGKSRKIEQALKSGDQVLVQVTKDPVGHKGARLSTQVSLAGRYLVYVPGGRSAGISRKLPETERKRLKAILKKIIPDSGGAIIRTAAEGVSEPDIEKDVSRLISMWDEIDATVKKEKKSKGSKPVTLYEEPDMLVKVIRDLFNEDFSKLIVDGDAAWQTVSGYVGRVAPDLQDRLMHWDRSKAGGDDGFARYHVDEQLSEALNRKVWLPSGGTLVIDRTEAMTVVDVNTGKYTGTGGNLEETVTKNNIEAAEELVRQMRLRDLGGMIVVDFIDMVLPENRDLVLRRLAEALMHDRTRHQISEVTSLGLVQMTRKRLGSGLIETFCTDCEACDGRGLIVHNDPVEDDGSDSSRGKRRKNGDKNNASRREQRSSRSTSHPPAEHPAARALHSHDDDEQVADKPGHARDTDRADRQDTAGSGRKDTSARDSEPTPDTEQGSSRRSRRGSRRGTGQPDTTREAAAQADAVPGEQPADGSSDTAGQPARGRRGRRRAVRPAEPAGTAAQPVSAAEESREESAADHADGSVNQSDRGGRQRRRAGRSRSTRSSSRSVAAENAQGKTPAEIAFDAVDTADREDPDEPSGRNYLPVDDTPTPPRGAVDSSDTDTDTDDGVTSYEQAMAAFEASPRRKRNVRGNSRSDVPPKRSDFITGPMGSDGIDTLDVDDDDEQAAAPEQPDHGSRSPRRADDAAGSRQSASAARRARRRATRAAQQGAGTAGETDQSADGGRRDSEQPSGSTDGTAPAGRGRGRRRTATAPSAAKSTPPAADGAGQPAAADDDDSAHGAATRRGTRRGRRRVTRPVIAPGADDTDAGTADPAPRTSAGGASADTPAPGRSGRGRRRGTRSTRRR
ncbi:translation initiation factor IF-2 N-terminal domain-containing protein [Corynebacterium mendelii]|uniref:Ribonuclease E n=1 Tax=Corynebacterium mendelii TaxID=2765362 RepID=A0A939E0F9_9CORY|nr:translation initiation factor IF-2 N-terminal domain-containing protein [Corynebacterium mendelii]